MGLTKNSVSKRATKSYSVNKEIGDDLLIAFCGNPNVGKSSIFNELTGLKQHTGNWPGKTVTSASGYIKKCNKNIKIVDLPGCYSMLSHSAEEEVSRDFICFSNPDAAVVVCDATCLERNLNLVLQIKEITPNVIVCINLIDQAKSKGISIDTDLLSTLLDAPVVLTSAKNKSGINELKSLLQNTISKQQKIITTYPPDIESKIIELSKVLKPICNGKLNERWLAVKLLTNDSAAILAAEKFLNKKLPLYTATDQSIEDIISASLVHTAENIAKKCIIKSAAKSDNITLQVDKFLTGKLSGYAFMMLLLFLIFWITIKGANYPSQYLSNLFSGIEGYLYSFFDSLGLNQTINDLLFHGIFRVLCWVVSVMLPPMAIFFPLFTLLEDLGYLPRVAFNLDKSFKKCSACGKQALTTCMGFGCNAAGIVGCRIIDSKRERLIAMITNSFIPCNGRFPAIIAIISMFFILSDNKTSQQIISALILTLVILLSVGVSLIMSKILSLTFLKGVPSSFTLELPPYRVPKIGQLLVRSVLDRTLYVLGRAVMVAAPAGLIIWLFANIDVYGNSLLYHCTQFLDPFGRFFGLDGTILMAFILGFPANEIVIPLMIMSYCSNNGLNDYSNLNELKNILISNGWTNLTAINTIIFTLFHFPCSTALITIKKESQSNKWTLLSLICPLITGLTLCFAVKLIYGLLF